MSYTYTGKKSLYSQSCREGHRRYRHHTKPESTEARPWGQPLKKSEGASLNLGQWFCNRNPPGNKEHPIATVLKVNMNERRLAESYCTKGSHV